MSIIDLDHAAKQPMKTNDSNFSIVFNGEIYNYQELKKPLLVSGVKFRTKSDTEVLLNGIYKNGIEFIDSCTGMFSFAAYNKSKNKLILVRDRLGIKPLYYYFDDQELIFSSEIKSILRLLKNRPSINYKAISSYLSFRYPIHNDTFFSGIQSLEPGCFLEFEKGNILKKKYWNPAKHFNSQQEDLGEDYYLEKVRRLMVSSVKHRMISDVPIGAYLSGGVDSSVVVASMAKESTVPVKTFSIGFGEEGYNEFSYARKVAERYRTEHREIVLSGDNYMDTMEHLIGFKDAPLSVPNEVPLYEMSRELKKYITVVLSGEGADEIFGGYGRIFRSCYDYQRLLSCREMNESERHVFLNNFKAKYGLDSFSSELDHFLNIYSYTSSAEKSELLSPEFKLDEMENCHREVFEQYFRELSHSSYENKMMYSFEKIHLPGLLHRVDMTTMATSVEARVPFVDHKLVEFAFSIPLKYKLRWNSKKDLLLSKTLMSNDISENYDTPKYILKKAFENDLPDEVLYRKKMGFPVPLNKWYGGKFNNYAKDILLSEKAKNRGIYNIKNVETWLNSDRLSVDHSFAMKIWMLLNIELFLDKYFN